MDLLQFPNELIGLIFERLPRYQQYPFLETCKKLKRVCCLLVRPVWTLSNWDVSVHLLEPAAAAGYLQILSFYELRKFPLRLFASVMRVACEGGHEAIICWMKSRGASVRGDDLACAARGGHLTILQRFMDPSVASLSAGGALICSYAAAGGHMHVLKWLESEDMLDKSAAALSAARNGHIVIMEWAAPPSLYRSLMLAAAKCNQVHVVEWLIAKLYGDESRLDDTIRAQLSADASSGGHFELSKRFFPRNGKPRPFLGYDAAEHGNVEMMRIALEHSSATSIGYMIAAVQKGHLEIVKELVSRGATLQHLPANLNAQLAYRGSIDLLQYLHANGFDMEKAPDSQNILDCAANGGNLELVRWLISIGIKPAKSTCRQAAASGRLEILKYLRKNFFTDWDMTELCSSALEFHFLEVVRWIRAGCPVT